MADLTLPTTPTPGGLPWEVIFSGIAGEAIASAGMTVVLNSSGQWIKADRDADSSYACVALNTAAAAGSPINVVVHGIVGGFTGLTPGVVYYLSNTAGKLCPYADVSGNVVPVGVATTSTSLFVSAALNSQAPADAISISTPERGDVIYRGASAWAALNHGTANQALLSGGHGANPAWGDVLIDPGTAEQGDIIYQGAAAVARLAHGTAGQVLSTGGNAADPSWVDAVTANFPASQARGDLYYRGASAVSRLAKGTSGQVLGIGANDPAWVDGLTTAFPSSQARGDVFFRGASTLERLAAGSKGQYLKTVGAAADPVWATPPCFITANISTASSGVTAELCWTYDLPAGFSATILDVAVSATAVGAAGASFDLFEAGTTILSAPVTIAVGEVKGVIADAAIAAGATLTIKRTTGAATGVITDGNVTIMLRLLDTN